jgi:hypothetical protein
MADITPIDTSRAFISDINTREVALTYDYPFAQYLVDQAFFDNNSEVLQAIIDKRPVPLDTGQEVDAETTGGLLAIQLWMETQESRRTTVSGLASSGLKVEQTLWKNI